MVTVCLCPLSVPSATPEPDLVIAWVRTTAQPWQHEAQDNSDGSVVKGGKLFMQRLECSEICFSHS